MAVVYGGCRGYVNDCCENYGVSRCDNNHIQILC